MLTDILVGIEAVMSFALVLLILLHSGRGGGLSDMFGSTVGTAAAGSTVAEKNLDRLTITVAVIFAFATVIIGLRWG
ncbi:MAG TPA: preprotein translocase subunit SecG [Acidimicrobiales bacterium]|nr:preprotein translocase subunit SecG [Acidimicrobiales bacterium]